MHKSKSMMSLGASVAISLLLLLALALTPASEVALAEGGSPVGCDGDTCDPDTSEPGLEQDEGLTEVEIIYGLLKWII
jgi:hypothetical protein